MSKTWRSFRPDGEPVSERRAREGATAWRADRLDRLTRAARDTKRIARAERYTDRGDLAAVFRIGSTVQVLA